MGSRLYQLRMKHQRAGRTDVESLLEDTNDLLSDYEPNDRLDLEEDVKHGEDNELEILAGIWEFVAENIEREEWETYTREDWEEIERNHVERAEYTEPDLFDDILTKYERGLFTADEAQAYAKRYRECQYRFCLNVFEPRRKDQRYCTGSDCRRREANAKIRFERTGTYLPPYVYKDNRDDTDEENYQKKEIAYDMEENGEMFARFKYKDEFGGKRDRMREAYYYQEVTEKELKDSGESRLNRHYNPVTNEERRAVV